MSVNVFILIRDPLIRDTVRQMVAQCGYNPIAMASTLGSVAALESTAFHILITDSGDVGTRFDVMAANARVAQPGIRDLFLRQMAEGTDNTMQAHLYFPFTQGALCDALKGLLSAPTPGFEG